MRNVFDTQRAVRLGMRRCGLQVRNTRWETLALLQVLQVGDEGSARLHHQDGVVTLPSALNGKVRDELRECRVGGVTVSSACLPTLLERVQTCPGAECLQTGSHDVQFLDLGSVILRVKLGRSKMSSGLHDILILELQSPACELEGDGLSQKWHESPLVNGVVENLSLNVVGTGTELSSDDTVSNGDSESLLRDNSGIGDHPNSTGDQGSVGHLRSSGVGDFAVLGDLSVLHHHVVTRYSDVTELQVPVVNTVSTHLLSDVTNQDSGQGLESLGVSDRHNESLRAVPLSVDHELGKDGTVGGGRGGSSDPPLGGSEERSVDDELVGLLVESGSGQESGHVGTVLELGHTETTNDSFRHLEDSLLDPVIWRQVVVSGLVQQSFNPFQESMLTPLLLSSSVSNGSQEKTDGNTEPSLETGIG